MNRTQANFDFRFGGIGRLYGPETLESFRRSKVCVIGIGGVGSWIVEALVRSGVGNLTLVDLDDVCESNINRQIHALDGSIGSAKTEVMAERCRLVNPECKVTPVHSFFTAKNADALLDQPFDYVIDAIDSAKHKAAIIVGCRQRKVPVLTIGGAGGRVDPTRIEIADLARSYNDPLLQRVRKLLRQEYGFPRERRRKFKVECVFSPEDARYPETCDTTESRSSRLDCASGYGAAAHLTGAFGFFATSAVLRSLAARSTLTGQT